VIDADDVEAAPRESERHDAGAAAEVERPGARPLAREPVEEG